MNLMKEKLQTVEIEKKSSDESVERIKEQLDLESSTRRKQEVTIRELQYELKDAAQSLETVSWNYKYDFSFKKYIPIHV